MAMQTYGLVPGRIDKFKGAILKHAVPRECLARYGRQEPMPQNVSDTYVARRFLPYGATSTNQDTINRFFADANGDRAAAMAAANQISEGVTPAPDSITAVDYSVVVQEYGCLYGFTDKTFRLYEDDIPAQMIKQVGERVTLVNEMIIYSQLRACTNQFYGGAGTSIATVNGAIALQLIRNIVMNLQANHGMSINTMLKAGPDFGTDGVEEGYAVVVHTDLEGNIRDLPGFVPSTMYASGKPMKNEIGKVERFRFITTPDLPPLQNAGATVASTGGAFFSTTGVNIDVYPCIVLAEDAFSQIAVRGLNSLDPTYLPPNTKEKSDPLGQRGYAGTKWWKVVLIENPGWMAIFNVARAV